MPTYILLSTLSPHGVGTLKANPLRLKEVNAEIEQMGAKVIQQWAVLGPYDFVNIVEADDEKVIARVSVEAEARQEAEQACQEAEVRIIELEAELKRLRDEKEAAP